MFIIFLFLTYVRARNLDEVFRPENQPGIMLGDEIGFVDFNSIRHMHLRYTHYPVDPKLGGGSWTTQMSNYAPIMASNHSFDLECVMVFTEPTTGSYDCILPPKCTLFTSKVLDSTWYGSKIKICLGYVGTLGVFRGLAKYQSITEAAFWGHTQRLFTISKSKIMHDYGYQLNWVKLSDEGRYVFLPDFQMPHIFKKISSPLDHLTFSHDWDKVCFSYHNYMGAYDILRYGQFNRSDMDGSDYMKTFFPYPYPVGEKHSPILYRCDQINLTAPYIIDNVWHFNQPNCSKLILVAPGRQACISVFVAVPSPAARCPMDFSLRKYVGSTVCLTPERRSGNLWQRVGDEVLKIFIDGMAGLIDAITTVFGKVEPIFEKFFIKLYEGLLPHIEALVGGVLGAFERFLEKLIPKFVFELETILLKLEEILIRLVEYLNAHFMFFEAIIIWLVIMYYFRLTNTFAFILTILILTFVGFRRNGSPKDEL